MANGFERCARNHAENKRRYILKTNSGIYTGARGGFSGLPESFLYCLSATRITTVENRDRKRGGIGKGDHPRFLRFCVSRFSLSPVGMSERVKKWGVWRRLGCGGLRERGGGRAKNCRPFSFLVNVAFQLCFRFYIVLFLFTI